MTNLLMPMTILVADDDADDQLLLRDAFDENHLLDRLRFVNDGEELMDYLNRRNKYAEFDSSPRPALILLDLNMPRKNGHQALQEIQADPELRLLRVVIMTTSSNEQDMLRSYDLGATSFITKPVTFSELLSTVEIIGKYWLEVVALPGDRLTEAHP